jgi:branched-chain amino acid aminotransferase
MRDHYERLAASARLLRLDLRRTPEELCDITVDLLRRNDHRGDTYIRPLAYKVSLEPGTPFGVRLRGVSSTLTISTMPMGAYVAREGIRCGVSTWRRLPSVCLPARAKVTGGYANNALAKEEVEAAGFDDALMLDTQGHVAEATTANVFVFANGVLSTPPASADILPGVTRATILEVASKELGLPTSERPILPTELRSAQEVFLTGTGVEVAPVIEVDGHQVGTGAAGQTATKLRALYEAIVRGRMPQFAHWLTAFSFG